MKKVWQIAFRNVCANGLQLIKMWTWNVFWILLLVDVSRQLSGICSKETNWHKSYCRNRFDVNSTFSAIMTFRLNTTQCIKAHGCIWIIKLTIVFVTREQKKATVSQLFTRTMIKKCSSQKSFIIFNRMVLFMPL